MRTIWNNLLSFRGRVQTLVNEFSDPRVFYEQLANIFQDESKFLKKNVLYLY